MFVIINYGRCQPKRVSSLSTVSNRPKSIRNFAMTAKTYHILDSPPILSITLLRSLAVSVFGECDLTAQPGTPAVKQLTHSAG